MAMHSKFEKKSGSMVLGISLCVLGMGLSAGSGFAREDIIKSIDVGKTPESAVYGFGGKLYVTLMGETKVRGDGDGKIVVVDQGKVEDFVVGLNDPKGIVFVGGKLITTDLDRLWAIDEKGNKTLFAGPEAFPKTPMFLNDIAVDPSGTSILVTDMGDLPAMFSLEGKFWPLDSEQAKAIKAHGRVYRVGLDGKVSVEIDHSPKMPNPNGVHVLKDGTILVAEFFLGTLMSYKNGEWKQLSDDHRSGDGIVNDSKGNLYLTEVKTGRVWKIPVDGGKKELLTTLESAADLIIDEKNKYLIVPDSKAGKLVYVMYEH
jgi:gluconolactonase